MYPLLLKGQSLTIERPSRTTGTLIGAAASLGALALALSLLLQAAGWPVSFPLFLALTGAGVLLVFAGIFAFWAYGCYSMRYVLGAGGLSIIWGPIRHFIAIDRIQLMTHGRANHRVKVGGIGWPGYHVGLGSVEMFDRVLFFSTHSSPEELVYIQTPTAIYAVSPADPVRFIAEAQKFQGAASPESRPAVQRDILSGHPIWADRVAQLLGAVAVLGNVALWGFVCAAYPDLNDRITIEFPPVGQIVELHARSDILKIPATATAILAVNLLAGLVFEWKERAAAYLLLSGAVFMQIVFIIAAIVAVANA